MLSILSIVTIGAAMSLSFPAAANLSFHDVRELLRSDGYTLIKMFKNDPLQVSAFDMEGSEVLITVSFPEGEISGIQYVHAMDK